MAKNKWAKDYQTRLYLNQKNYFYHSNQFPQPSFVAHVAVVKEHANTRCVRVLPNLYWDFSLLICWTDKFIRVYT